MTELDDVPKAIKTIWSRRVSIPDLHRRQPSEKDQMDFVQAIKLGAISLQMGYPFHLRHLAQEPTLLGSLVRFGGNRRNRLLGIYRGRLPVTMILS